MARTPTQNIRTLVLEEELLDTLVELTDAPGEMPHRAIHHLLRQLRSMGHSHRDNWSIRLFNGDSDADLDPAYAEHLDRLNSGLPSEWPPIPSDEEP